MGKKGAGLPVLLAILVLEAPLKVGAMYPSWPVGEGRGSVDEGISCKVKCKFDPTIVRSIVRVNLVSLRYSFWGGGRKEVETKLTV
jgi:hypothetical protein